MTQSLYALGPFRFAVDTAAPDALQRGNDYRWQEQGELSIRPRLQFIGPGAETITLAGTIYPQFAGGLGQVERMREMAAAGIPHLLIDGRGNRIGRYAIERVDETSSLFLADGTPRKIEFRLALKRFDEARPDERTRPGRV